MPKKTKFNKKLLAMPLSGTVITVFALLVLGAGGFAFAAYNESHDNFCASCHTQPETTFYQRSIDAHAVDLASVHTAKNVACIDCHSGAGITGRMQAELLGARNAAAWLANIAQQPAPLTFSISDQNCLKCHQEVIAGRATRNNHFHVLLSEWQAATADAASCVSCHNGHNTSIDPKTAYLNIATTQQVCNNCHRTQRRGR